jgi:UDP-glucose:(heptosyl)LPS alpha-1,3-glucosyltransferase
MRIAIITTAYHREGGSERRTTELVRFLLRRGHEVDVLAAAWSEPAAGDPETAVRFVRVPARRVPRWMWELSFALHARRLVERRRYDIVHSQAHTLVQDVVTAGGGCHAAWLDVMRTLRPGPAGWYSAHKIGQRITLALERRQMAATGALIANSELSRHGFIERALIGADRAHVVHNGVDAVCFEPGRLASMRDGERRRLGFGDDDIVLLHVGAGFERKGVAEAIRALAIARKAAPAMRLCVVGKGRTRQYARLAGRLGCGDAVRFVGHVSPVDRAYAAADAYVLLTHFDPFANTTMEALAAGLPVLTTNMNGVSEILTDGASGLIVGARDTAESTAQRLLELTDPDRRRALGNAGRRVIESGFTWDETGRNTIAVYEHVLHR